MLVPKRITRLLLVTIFSNISPVVAHTWIEQLINIAPNGTMIGQPGFPRGNVQRSSPAFRDTAMVFLIPPNGAQINNIATNQLMCRPEQTTQTQGADSPRLKAAPGQAVALRYQENGHVTLPNNTPGKPDHSGTNFVYYTTNSKPDDKFLQIHRQWTADGKGGDARGRLISTQFFDDGQCYQVNGQTISKQRQAEFPHAADKQQGMDLWCQQDIQIPADAAVGATITLYWVWDWPTLAGTPGFPQGKQEIYTSCMDIDIVAPAGQSKAVAQGFVRQDVANAAVSAQFADIANPSAVKAQLIPFSSVSATSSSSAPGGRSTTSTRSSNSVVPVSQTIRPSASSTAAQNPGVVTVTVRETVTVKPSSSSTRSADEFAATVTATQTKFVTVVGTKAAANASQPVSVAPVSAVPVVQKSSCSKSKRAFQLRARKPFYIVPVEGQPTSTAGSGC